VGDARLADNVLSEGATARAAVDPTANVVSCFYELTVPDGAVRTQLLGDLARDPAGAAVLEREQTAFLTYGSAPQPLF
jgi:hypothetical protein